MGVMNLLLHTQMTSTGSGCHVMYGVLSTDFYNDAGAPLVSVERMLTTREALSSSRERHECETDQGRCGFEAV